MNSFIGQEGTLQFHYPKYGVLEVAPFSPQPRIRPNARIYLLTRGKDAVELHRGNWGMGTGRFDWNARDDRLGDSPLWKHLWLKPGGHVVVPATHVYEATTRHGARQWYAIHRRDDEPLWIAALGRVQQGQYRVEWHVSMVTVDAGPVFDDVHDKPREVVCLRNWREVEAWLAADDEKRLRALLRSGDAVLLESYRVHDDVLKDAYPASDVSKPWKPAQRMLG